MSGFSGSCSCGAVTYRVATHPRRVVNCHCNMCRKMNGSAFSAYVAIPRKGLIVSGEGHLARYPVTGRAIKHYCKACGTPVFNLNARFPEAAMLHLGSVEPPATFVPSVNVYCESMLQWVKEMASMAKFEKGA